MGPVVKPISLAPLAAAPAAAVHSLPPIADNSLSYSLGASLNEINHEHLTNRYSNTLRASNIPPMSRIEVKPLSGRGRASPTSPSGQRQARPGIQMSPSQRGVPRSPVENKPASPLSPLQTTDVKPPGEKLNSAPPPVPIRGPSSRGGRYGNIVSHFEENTPGPLANFGQNHHQNHDTGGNSREGVSGPFALSRERISSVQHETKSRNERKELVKTQESFEDWPEPPTLEDLNMLMVEKDDQKKRTNLKRSVSLCEMKSESDLGGTMKSLNNSREEFYSEIGKMTKECRSESKELLAIAKELKNVMINVQENKPKKVIHQRASSESRMSTKEKNQSSNRMERKVSTENRTEKMERNEYNHLKKAGRHKVQPPNFSRPNNLLSPTGFTKSDEDYFKALQDAKRNMLNTQEKPPIVFKEPSKQISIKQEPKTSLVISSIEHSPTKARSSSLSKMEIQIGENETSRHLQHIEGTFYDPTLCKEEFTGIDVLETQRKEMIKKIMAEKERATANIDTMLKTIEQRLENKDSEEDGDVFVNNSEHLPSEIFVDVDQTTISPDHKTDENFTYNAVSEWSTSADLVPKKEWSLLSPSSDISSACESNASCKTVISVSPTERRSRFEAFNTSKDDIVSISEISTSLRATPEPQKRKPLVRRLSSTDRSQNPDPSKIGTNANSAFTAVKVNAQVSNLPLPVQALSPNSQERYLYSP